MPARLVNNDHDTTLLLPPNLQDRRTMSALGVTSGPQADRAIQWLLGGDPAIRWQALRGLVGAAEGTVERERRRVARDGWGARLLAKQDPEGTWAGGLSSDGGLYSPKWVSTHYTMLLLRDFGLPVDNRQARAACTLLLDRGLQRDGGVNYGMVGRERDVHRARPDRSARSR